MEQRIKSSFSLRKVCDIIIIIIIKARIECETDRYIRNNTHDAL
jgi:hypothetical protein